MPVLNCRDLGCRPLPNRTRLAHCAACHADFNSDAGFDKHRTGGFGSGRRCRTADEMREVGMSVNAAGRWITSAREADSEALDTPSGVFTLGSHESPSLRFTYDREMPCQVEGSEVIR